MLFFQHSEVIGLVVAFVILLVALVGVSGMFITWFCKQHHQTVRMQKKAQSCKNIIITILIIMSP
jgi:hypothetical protein